MFDSMELVTIKKLAGKVTQPIDPEFLPPGYGGGGVSSWNDLTDRPFGSEVKHGVALDIGRTPVNDEGLVVLNYPISIFAGEQYAVRFNGDDFNCTAIPMDDPDAGVSAILLGNIGALAGEEGTGETFFLMVANGMTNIMPLDGTAAVGSMTITGLTEVVETIDEKYLPKDGGVGVRYIDYEIDGMEENGKVPLKCPYGYEAIKEMSLSGQSRVVARCEITDGYIVHLPFNALYLGVLQFVAFNADKSFSHMLVIEHEIDGNGGEHISLKTHEISLT